MTNAWNLFRTVQKQNIGMLKFQREVAMTILASFARNKLAKSLAFPRNVTSNVKLDTKNHILVKGTSKYCCCKHCGGRSICLYQKCNVALQPDCFKDYHSWNIKLIVLFPTGKANNVNPLSAMGNLSCHPIFLGPKYKNSKFCNFLALYSLYQLVNNFGQKIINFQSLAFYSWK